MKRKILILITVIFFTLLDIGFAQTKTDVGLRVSKNNGVTRLVFEAEESFLKKTNVTASGLQVNVEFPSVFNLIPQKDINLETSIKDRLLTINLKQAFEMKVLKLPSPSRLVIDISSSGSKEAVDIKPQADVLLSQRVFVIDPGHGGYEFGIVNNDLKEKDIVLSIAKDIEGLLVKKDKKVFLTRRSDQFMPLRDRAIFANQKMIEIFMSIHVSGSDKFSIYVPELNIGSGEESESYSLNLRQKRYVHKSRKLAEALGKAIKEEFKLDVVQREMSLPLLNSVGAPAALLEVPLFKNLSYDQKTRSRLAQAIIKGFAYYGQ
ncbi:MAG: N-acetylmuramoyl-L-alanine amidase [Nitrospirae bacterium]|nr:N-acetylmuramoyl-L-alanine amidase [Nitrospirota bacterium]